MLRSVAWGLLRPPTPFFSDSNYCRGQPAPIDGVSRRNRGISGDGRLDASIAARPRAAAAGPSRTRRARGVTDGYAARLKDRLRPQRLDEHGFPQRRRDGQSAAPKCRAALGEALFSRKRPGAHRVTGGSESAHGREYACRRLRQAFWPSGQNALHCARRGARSGTAGGSVFEPENRPESRPRTRGSRADRRPAPDPARRRSCLRG